MNKAACRSLIQNSVSRSIIIKTVKEIMNQILKESPRTMLRDLTLVSIGYTLRSDSPIFLLVRPELCLMSALAVIEAGGNVTAATIRYANSTLERMADEVWLQNNFGQVHWLVTEDHGLYASEILRGMKELEVQ